RLHLLPALVEISRVDGQRAQREQGGEADRHQDGNAAALRRSRRSTSRVAHGIVIVLVRVNVLAPIFVNRGLLGVNVYVTATVTVSPLARAPHDAAEVVMSEVRMLVVVFRL